MSDVVSESPYSVLLVRSTREECVQMQLLRLSIDALLPTMKVKARDRRTRKPILESRVVFPGYVFVRFPDESTRRQVYNDVSYVIDFLRFGEQRAYISAADMDNIQRLLASEAPIYRRVGFVPGQRVRVRSGCMAGLVGEFVREGGESRVVLNLPLFGRSIATPIDSELVEAISNDAGTLVQ